MNIVQYFDSVILEEFSTRKLMIQSALNIDYNTETIIINIITLLLLILELLLLLMVLLLLICALIFLIVRLLSS